MASSTITGEDHEFRADHVVVTVPLGVLRAGEPVFEPSLPVEKRKAIDRIGFGRAITVAFRYPESSVKRPLGRDVLIWAGGTTTFLPRGSPLRDRRACSLRSRSDGRRNAERVSPTAPSST